VRLLPDRSMLLPDRPSVLWSVDVRGGRLVASLACGTRRLRSLSTASRCQDPMRFPAAVRSDQYGAPMPFP